MTKSDVRCWHSRVISSGAATTSAQRVAVKALHGAFSLGIRQALVQGTRILGGIFLARLLTPAQFGIYAIVLYLQTFLAAFGDAGLAASLIRQHEEPEAEDYLSVFTVQQTLVLLVTLALWVASPYVAARYHLRVQDAWLFRLTALSLLVTSFMVVPLARLERHLAFQKIALIESAQAIVFNGFSVYLAWKGLGSYAFVWALLLRSAAGAALANWKSPWRIGWRWDWPRIRSHLSFGLPYQGIQIVSLIKDSITPVLVGFLLGTTFVGYITWASITAAYPVLVLVVLQRLYMPAFSRLQRDPKQLVALAENVVWANNAVAAPLAVLTLALIVPLTRVVYGEKWLVALPYFYLFWTTNLVVPLTTPAMGLLNALGKSKVVLMFATLWMAGTWVIGAPLIWMYGAIGFPVATVVVNLSSYGLYKITQRYVPFRVARATASCWACAGGAGLVVYYASRTGRAGSMSSLAAYGAFGLLVYAGGMYLLHGRKLRAIWYSLRARG